jgi:zinc protease
MNLKLGGLALPNGMRVVIARDPAATEIEVTTRYRVGSVDDPADHPGMAHLVEHLMFQQTLGSQSLFAHLEDAATSFNAMTTFDATTYVTRAPAARLDELLSIEAVRVGFRCMSISDAVFEREREVVANEVAQRDAGTEVLTALHEALYPAGHPYRRPVGGSVDSVRAITREQACAFADAHYGPSNGVLVVSGNVTDDQVVASLKKFLARVGKHDTVAPGGVPMLHEAPGTRTAPAPIDDPAVMLAWPLPADPKERIEVAAIASTVVAAIDGDVKGRVSSLVLGDDSALALAIVIEPAADESVDEVIKSATQTLADVPTWLQRTSTATFGELAFDTIQQGAIYRTYAALESAEARNIQLAIAVLAGHDPDQQLSATFEGLRALTPEEAARVAREHLSGAQATIITLTPSGKKTGATASVAAAIHDLGQRRDPPDPADARKPAAGEDAGIAGVRTRTLPNGLRVVLLPLTSVPAIDIRLVFAAGTADEPLAKRGVALVAAHALSWDPRYINDLLPFLAAAGATGVDVDTDTTTFSTRGVDMHLDLLLAGLRRWVVDGRYDDNAETLGDVLRAQAKRIDDTGALTDAWRTARYGAGHPYIAAGLVRYIARGVTESDVASFRAGHYAPDDATLVIAGRFDAALADRWIDYLFADWHGHAEARQAPHATPSPASIASIEDLAQVRLAISIPATAGDRASQLVAAAMLDDLANDVRHQLGASYGVYASLDDRRLASEYSIAGSVEATRAADAVKLLSERIAQLHSDPVAAARAFVVARHRVLARLASVADTSAGLAAHVESAIATGAIEETDAKTASEVRALTIDSMAATLGDLDLARAAVLMRGPSDAFQPAFGVLGRTPAIVKIDRTAKDSADVPEAPASASHEHHSRFELSDVQTSLTEQGVHTLTVSAAIGLRIATLVEPDTTLTYDNLTGPAFIGEVGYRVDHKHAVGLELGYARLSGSFTQSLSPLMPLNDVVYDIDGFAQVTAYDRMWGQIALGAHLDHYADAFSAVEWKTAIGIGLEGGVDLVKIGVNRLGIWLRIDGTLASSSGYDAVMVGAGYRR